MDPTRSDARLDRRNRRDDVDAWTATSRRGAVATAHYLATDVGTRVLRDGGNAIDAAVAASFALAVCESAGSGLGGMALAVVHLAAENRTFTIEGPCRAPRLATPEAVRQSHRYRGYRAIAVPGHVAAMERAHRRYGSKPLDDLMAGAIELAERGVPVAPLLHDAIEKNQEELATRSGGALFLDAAGHALPAGSLLRQPALARTLTRLRDAGLRDFYEGAVAAEIAKDIETGGGFVRADDLAAMHAREAEPLHAPYRGATAHVLGPPGGGLSLAQLLFVLDELETWPDLADPADVVWIAKLIREVRRTRQRMRFVTEVDHPGGAGETLSTEWARDVLQHALGTESTDGETSHLSVMDAQGNAVSLTQSIERSFGSAEASPGLGFLYNGYLRGLKVQEELHPHFLRPGVAARSNAAPTIIVRDGQPWITIGSTGSERMVSGIFTTLLRLRGESPFRAVQGARLHATPSSVARCEIGRLPATTAAQLSAAGFEIEALDDYAFLTGGLQLVVRDGTSFTGVADPRRDGSADG